MKSCTATAANNSAAIAATALSHAGMTVGTLRGPAKLPTRRSPRQRRDHSRRDPSQRRTGSCLADDEDEKPCCDDVVTLAEMMNREQGRCNDQRDSSMPQKSPRSAADGVGYPPCRKRRRSPARSTQSVDDADRSRDYSACQRSNGSSGLKHVEDVRVDDVDGAAGCVGHDLVEDIRKLDPHSSRVTYPMCGVHTTLSIASSGSSPRNGSSS